MVVEELVAKLGLEIDGSTFKIAEELMASARHGFVAIGAAAVAAAGGLAVAIAKTAAHGEAIEKAAQRTGIGVESLQALEYAAERAQVGSEGLRSALNFMAKRGVKDFEAELRRAADELQRMPDGGAKAARAIALFGKHGAALIPMLNKGAAGLDEMTAFAREAGIVLSKDMVEAAAETNDAIEEMKAFLEGLAYTIAGPFLRPVREWLKAAGKWISANRAIISQRVEKAFTALAVAAKSVWQMMKPLVGLAWDLASNVWVLRAGAALLAFMLASTLGSAAMAAATAVRSLAKSFSSMTLSGIGAMIVPALIGAALIALALVAEDVYQFLQGNDSLMGTLGVKYVKWLDKVLAINPEDSALVRGLKYVGQVIFDLQTALQNLDAWIQQNSFLKNVLNTAGHGAGYVLSGAAGMLPGQLGTDAAERQRQHAGAMGFYAGRAGENVVDFGGRNLGAYTAPSPYAPYPYQAGGPVISISGVVVHASPGVDGAAVADDFVARVKAVIGVELRTEYVTARAAAQGP